MITFSNIFVAVLSLTLLALLLWFIVRRKYRRVWFPLLAIFTVPRARLPRLRLRWPPRLAFLCFLLASSAALLFALRPHSMLPAAETKRQLQLYLFIDFSPSLAAYVSIEQYRVFLQDVYIRLRKLGDLTVGTSHNDTMQQFVHAQAFAEHLASLTFHRAGLHMASVLRQQLPRLSDMDRTIIVSDRDQHTWGSLHWQHLTIPLYHLAMPQLRSAADFNLYVQRVSVATATHLTKQRLDIEIAAAGKLNIMRDIMVTVYHDQQKIAQTQASIAAGQARVLLTLALPHKFKLSGARGARKRQGASRASGARGARKRQGASRASGARGARKRQGASRASGARGARKRQGASRASGARGARKRQGASRASGASLPLRLHVQTAHADAVPLDDEFYFNLASFVPQATIIADLYGERVLDDPLFQLQTALQVLGFKIKRRDHASRFSATSDLWILAFGKNFTVPQHCPTLSKKTQVWLLPQARAFDEHAVCHCYQRLRGFDKPNCATLAQALKQDKARRAKFFPLYRRANLTVFTVPLYAQQQRQQQQQQSGLRYASVPVLIQQLLQQQGLGIKQALHQWPRPADIFSLAVPMSKPANVPRGESLLQTIAQTALPPAVRFDPQGEQLALPRYRKDALLWVQGLLALAMVAALLEIIGVLLFARKYKQEAQA